MTSNENPVLSPHYDERGLVPAVIQDADTGQVLMLAYMNKAAFQKTLESGQTHFWSRSRQELWHKGATSGNIQHVVDIHLDCDQDAVLVRVRPAGPACHTGQVSCFHNPLPAVPLAEPLEDSMTLDELYKIICDRRDHPAPESYTARLFSQGEDEILKKVGEEAMEIILAAKGQGNQRLTEEIADLTYHLLVLMAAHNLTPEDIRQELGLRHRPH